MDYKNLILSYGIITILIVLQELEAKQNFEECQKIINAINSVNKYLEIELPTHITTDAIEEVIKDYLSFNIKTDTDKVMQQSTFYAQEIIELIYD